MSPDAASAPLHHTRIRSAWLSGSYAKLVTLVLALIALAGCGREPIISPLAASPASSFPLRTTMLPQEQAAAGLVGVMVTATPPSPTASPPPAATSAPPVEPPPLIGFALPQPAEFSGSPPSVAAAELIAAGSALQFAGACREAISLYEQALVLDPNFANVYALLGLCLYDQGQIDAAVTRWQEALSYDPLSPDGLAGLGTALYRLGQREAGLELYRQAVSVDPGYIDETYLRADRLWSAPALLDSRVLRSALAP